jgi:hypothetical protein
MMKDDWLLCGSTILEQMAKRGVSVAACHGEGQATPDLGP